MKKQKRKIVLGVVIIIILCIFFLLNFKNTSNGYQDELIFFKLFSSGKQENIENFKKNSQKNQSIFQVSYQNIDFQNLYLSDTADPKTLIQEKIAPRNRRCI